MKRILHLIMVVLPMQFLTAQVAQFDGDSYTLAGGKYIFKENKHFQKIAQTSTTVEVPEIDVTAGDVVEIVKVENDVIYFKNVYDDTDTTTTYLLRKEDFYYYTTQLFRQYKGAEVGVYTIPFRLRGKGDTFDFESNLSLQTNLIFGFGSRKSQNSWLDASVGLGLSSINLNENNSLVTENRTASALTWSIGTVVKPAKNVNFGLFVGADYLGMNDRKVEWKYNKKAWIGLGINISFNKVETSSPASSVTPTQKDKAKKNVAAKKAKQAQKSE